MHSTAFPKTQLQSTQITFCHLALSLGYYTPYIAREGKQGMVSVPQFLNALNGLRWAIWKDRNLLKGLYHKTTFVVPDRWPGEVYRAFKLHDPPTPYEVSCAISVEPVANFWGFQRGFDPKTKCDYSALLWWLMGFPEEAMVTHLGLSSRRELRKRMAHAVRKMMESRKFSIWAGGINLSPYCTNRFMREAVDSFINGKALPKDFGGQRKRHRNAQSKIFNHPFISSQIASGRRHGRKIRPLYTEGVLWLSEEDKKHWERGGGVGPERIKAQKAKIQNEKAKQPEWLHLSIP